MLYLPVIATKMDRRNENKFKPPLSQNSINKLKEVYQHELELYHFVKQKFYKDIGKTREWTIPITYNGYSRDDLKHNLNIDCCM